MSVYLKLFLAIILIMSGGVIFGVSASKADLAVIQMLPFDLVTLGLLSVILVIVGAVLFLSSVTPINLLKSQLEKFGTDDFRPFDLAGRKDEWGRMLKLVNDAQQKMSDELKLAAQAKEDAHQASEAKTRFLASMSHEIRTPLTAIKGFSEVINKEATHQPALVSYTTNIIESCAHLSGLIDGILDLSKIEAGKLELINNEINLFDLLDKVELAFSEEMKKKGLGFAIAYDWPLPQSFVSDALRINQIIFNLVSNALKFTSQGRVSVNVSYKSDNESLCISVRDTGIGMTAEEQHALFSAFHQASAGVSHVYGGTGLGLHLSKILAQLLGGDISVVSEKNSGSQFVLTLPIDVSGNAGLIYQKPQPMEDVGAESGGTLHFSEKTKILIAEDNKINQKLIRKIFNAMNLFPTIVSDGVEVPDQLEAKSFDIIFLDIRMPVVDGIAACKTIRSMGLTVPVCALTANVFKEDVDTYFAAGFTEVLAKPIDQNKLQEVLAKYAPATSTHEVEELDVPPAANKAPKHGFESVLSDSQYNELLDIYYKTAAGEMVELEKFIVDREFEKAADVAHSIRGTAGMLSINDIFEQCTLLEKSCRDAQEQTIQAHFLALTDIMKTKGIV